MSFKQLLLGVNYAKIRSPRSQETHSYVQLIRKLQKSHVDTMRHRRRKIKDPYTVPVFLHRNDILNKNLNLRKLTKIIMKDLLSPEDESFVFKFMINERYAQKKHVSNEAEQSFRLLLNKISDRPIVSSETDFQYNRSNELGLYLEGGIDSTVIPITPEDHQRMLKYLSSKLKSDCSLVESPKQFYIKFESTHSKILGTLREPIEFSTTWWQRSDSYDTVKVRIEVLELADKVAYIGINESHSNYENLVNRKLINPVTGVDIQIVRASDDLMSDMDKDELFGIMPNHILTHREYCSLRGLPFHRVSQYDLHSGPYLKKHEMYQDIFSSRKLSEPIIPVILSPTSIKNHTTGELFNITKFSVVGYINLVEELKSSIIELLTSISGDLFERINPYPESYMIPTENLWLSLMVLRSMDLPNKYRLIEVPKILDYDNRDISKLRPDFNKIYNGVPIDYYSEEFSNRNSLFSEKQFPQKTDGTISIDLVRGALLNPTKDKTVIFDDLHKTSELFKLTLLFDLFNNYSIKFIKQKDIKSVLIDVGFKNIFLDNPNQAVKDWNYYMMYNIIDGMIDFFEAKKNGEIDKMQIIFTDILLLVTNGYWDLLNSEIILAVKKPVNLPPSKVYLKHLMGTVLYYIHLMGQSFYLHECSYVLKKLPLLRLNYDVQVEFDRYEENLEVYNRNVNDLKKLNDKLVNYVKVFDTDILSNGKMFIEITRKLKEIVTSKQGSQQKYTLILEIQDAFKFLTVKEFQKNLDVIYAIFKPRENFVNQSIKVVTEMSNKFINFHQQTPVYDGVESFGVPNCPAIYFHLVKVEDADLNDDSIQFDELEFEQSDETEGEKVTFKDIMSNEQMQKLLQSDNSNFDKVFQEILNVEKKKQLEMPNDETLEVEAKN